MWLYIIIMHGKISTLQHLENGWFTIVVIFPLVKNYQLSNYQKMISSDVTCSSSSPLINGEDEQYFKIHTVQ